MVCSRVVLTRTLYIITTYLVTFLFTYLLVVCLWAQVQGMVDSYKGANVDIANIGKGISEMLLVRIDPHRVYENLEFEEDQVG